MAERVGFEPTVGLLQRRFSRPVHSTALPPLHSIQSICYSDYRTFFFMHGLEFYLTPTAYARYRRQLPARRIATLLYSAIKNQIGGCNADHQPMRLWAHRGISGGRRRRPQLAAGPTAHLEHETRRQRI